MKFRLSLGQVELVLDPVEMTERKLVELLLQFPDFAVLHGLDGFVRRRFLVFGFPNVLPSSRVQEHFGRAPEERGQGLLQDVDERLQIFGDADQEVFVHQVVFGLLQGPTVAGVPALEQRDGKENQ